MNNSDTVYSELHISSHEMRLPYDILRLVIKSTDKTALYGIALTCRALSEPALRELWHTMDSLVPLALLIPSKFYDEYDFERVPPSILTLPEERRKEFRKDDPVLARMLTYGKHIKVLRGINSNRFCLPQETLRFLLYGVPDLLGVEHMIPNLTKLWLKNELVYRADSLLVRGLFVSSLRSIVLIVHHAEGQDRMNQVILKALQNCPTLADLKLVCAEKFYQKSVMLDFRSIPREFESLSIVASTTSIKSIQVIPAYASGCCNLFWSPSTLVILEPFKSITRLEIALDTSHQHRDHPLFETLSPNSLFPALKSLRLRFLGSAPATWFFDVLNGANLRMLYLHIVEEISTSHLDAFVSSLGQYRQKFSNVSCLGFRATVYGEGDQLPVNERAIPSVVAAVAQLSPSLIKLKLKLFPPATHEGLAEASDLPRIVEAFPHLQTLKVAASRECVHLPDIVALARRFPGLRKLGIAFGYELDEDEPSHSPSPLDEVAASGLRILDVRESLIFDPEPVAAYLRKNLPQLSNVTCSQKSDYRDEWSLVNRLLSDHD